MKPDFEAEEIVSQKRKNPMELTNKSDLLKPVKDDKKQKKSQLSSKTGDDNQKDDNGHIETKGFDTLMADDLE